MEVFCYCDHCGKLIRKGDPCSYDHKVQAYWCVTCTAYAHDITEEEVIALAKAQTEFEKTKPTIH